jgi:hypothetical protein
VPHDAGADLDAIRHQHVCGHELCQAGLASGPRDRRATTGCHGARAYYVNHGNGTVNEANGTVVGVPSS